MTPGTRVVLLPVKKRAEEWVGLRGTVVEPPNREEATLARWIWVKLDGEKTTYFYKSELRVLSLVEQIGELS